MRLSFEIHLDEFKEVAIKALDNIHDTVKTLLEKKQ